MPTIVFQVNLNTPLLYRNRQPYNVYPQGSPAEGVIPHVIESANFPFTRSTWLPNIRISNYDLKHGDTFTATGMDALYLRNNYTTGDYAVLNVVSYTP